MKIYIAAPFTNFFMKGQRYYGQLRPECQKHPDNISDILESWHWIHKQKFVDAIRETNRKVFLDSGAFSAYTLGAQLSVSDYCEFIKRNIDILAYDEGVLMASVLDGIGDALLTYRNQLEMESRGVKPLPCFHAGEDERYLEYYIKNYEYITLGGMVGASISQLATWLDRIWNSYLVDGSGNPRIKVHGFGITTVRLMQAYPWWSVDSSTWVQNASFGSVILPTPQREGLITNIPISDKNPNRKNKGAHVYSLTQAETDYLENIMLTNGFDIENLRTNFPERAAFNLWSFERIRDIINDLGPKKLSAKLDIFNVE